MEAILNMEAILKLVTTIPELIVMVLIVKAFLQAMRERDKLFTDSINQINKENIGARSESREVIAENSRLTRQSTIAMTEMTTVLREMKDSYPKKTV